MPMCPMKGKIHVIGGSGLHTRQQGNFCRTGSTAITDVAGPFPHACCSNTDNGETAISTRKVRPTK
jgi:hypothetical protein